MGRVNGYALHIFLTLLLFILMLLLALVPSADAAPIENDDPGISNGIFEADYTRLPDDSNATYNIDVSDKLPDDEEGSAGEGFMDSIQNFNPVGDTVEKTAMEFINILSNLGLQWNMMLTNMMIGVLNFSFETDIIDSWVDSMDQMVQQMAGVSGLSITGGLFGTLLSFAVVASALVAMYQMFAQRATMASLNTLLRTVLALSLALVFFANFGTIMKGMNQLSTEISASLLTGTANVVTGDDRSQDQVRKEVSANLWNEFIGRPYMILQYGSDDIDKVGEERVNELLALPIGEDRTEFVEEVEIAERGNTTMTYASVIERFAFTFVYSTINAIVSIPIYGLALAMIIFQLWFLMIAIYGPFALIQSTFPGQFPVLKRYAVELLYPLVCKVIATVATLFIFTLGFMIYSIEINVGIARYFISAFMQFALFGVFFFGRKRIANIMSAGARGPFEPLRYEIRGLKQSMMEATNKIGSVTKTAATIGVAAATGGTSTAVTSAVTTAAALAASNNTEAPADAYAAPEANYSQPMIRADAHEEAAHAPNESETAAPASQPITRIDQVETADGQDLNEQQNGSSQTAAPVRADAIAPVPMERMAEIQPIQQANEQDKEVEPQPAANDLSKPLARIDEIERPTNPEIRVKQADDGNVKYKEGENK